RSHPARAPPGSHRVQSWFVSPWRAPSKTRCASITALCSCNIKPRALARQSSLIMQPLETAMRLANKTALITGGNSGIGLATARLFVAEGARVAVTGRNKETLEAAAKELGPNALAI